MTPSESLGPKKTWMPGSSQQHLPVFEPDTSFGDLPADFAIFDDFPAGGVLDSSIDLPMDHAEWVLLEDLGGRQLVMTTYTEN